MFEILGSTGAMDVDCHLLEKLRGACREAASGIRHRDTIYEIE